jgi:hypothetical protein
MENLSELIKLKDQLQKQIIRCTILAGRYLDRFRILINDPVPYQLVNIDGNLLEIIIGGVDGDSCELIDNSPTGQTHYIRYHDIPVEQLTKVLNQIENNQYTIKKHNGKNLINTV